MGKRKLTRRQAWRVEKIQSERTARAQQRGELADQLLNEGELGPEQQGQVMAHYGSQIDVEAADGSVRRCHLRTNLQALVTGDQVIWRDGKPTGVVVASLPRRSLLARPESSGQLRPLAANIDVIVLVIAPAPEPHPNLINRYLIAAQAVGIEPVILLNKTDLLNEEQRSAMMQLLGVYSRIGYRLLEASTTQQSGLDALRELLRDRTSVFVGQSGVGKSSLIKALLPGIDIRIGALSIGKAKGTHTTTTAKLFRFPAGGQLIDSPGIREFGLWHMEPADIARGFIEFQPFLGLCKFRDCRHQQDPGCALQKAVADGHIDPTRLRSYADIVASLTLN